MKQNLKNYVKTHPISLEISKYHMRFKGFTGVDRNTWSISESLIGQSTHF